MKNTFYIYLSLLFLGILSNAQAQKLRFNNNHTFKILQITDTHWDNKSKKCEDTKNTIITVVNKEKPDFIIVTGDIITQEPIKDGWIALSKILSEQNIPWSVTFGNHDEEGSMKKTEIWKLLKRQANFIGESSSVSGVGNCAIPIYSNKGNKPAEILYLFDSHDYTDDTKLGHYDWIKHDQIKWYRKTSDDYTKANNGKTIPSLAFFHIPLLEYQEVASQEKTLIGEKYEGLGAAELNPGLFTSMVEKKDMVGVFVGHAHDNNYIGILKDIALAFGQVTGADAYGKMERGGRVIELYEGKRNFKTWISTPTATKHVFYYPSGLSEINESTKVLSASKLKAKKNGVKFKYYEGTIQKTADISSLKVKKEGVIPNFSIDNAEIEDHFAFKFEAWIKIPETAMYKFYTRSDDGSVLIIDNEIVVDNDGGHSAKRETNMVALEAGFHKIEVLYFEDYMGNELSVGMYSVKIPEGKIADNLLFVED